MVLYSTVYISEERMCLFITGYLLGLLLYPEDGGSILLINISVLLIDYTASHPRR
jgi:hypothetical protein